MSGRRAAPKILLTLAILTLVVSIVGFIGSILLNAFAFDKYNVYGEVPIPGQASLHLPAGEVNITFHTSAVGSPGGGGLPIPELGLSIDPPQGVPQPQVTESFGSTTSVNNDIRRRVWVAQIPAEGTYRISTDGKVSAFIGPRLAFGHGGTMGWLPWLFAALFVMAMIDLVVAVVWLSRRRRAAPAVGLQDLLEFDTDREDMNTTAVPSQPTQAYIPTDEGIRLEQLKDIAVLRDSGALTEEEFEQEKRRVLDGN